jgi:hypothetical protein
MTAILWPSFPSTRTHSSRRCLTAVLLATTQQTAQWCASYLLTFNLTLRGILILSRVVCFSVDPQSQPFLFFVAGMGIRSSMSKLFGSEQPRALNNLNPLMEQLKEPEE